MEKLSTCAAADRGSGGGYPVRSGPTRSSEHWKRPLYTLYQQTERAESSGRCARQGVECKSAARSGFGDFVCIDLEALSRTVRQAEIRLRAHLDETRGGALEFTRLIALGAEIKRVRLRLRRSKQFHRV